ncbi:Stage II sporulation protein E (SpoIIE) [Fodinibius salinus]|uniref:Stage II sporulation protein E (SpoIIE) n=1 Tax=Fodinibius salinus TaxID=860790 RepID=A0A5D3YFI0_9BACT|nr:PP2C family protein-serine/threonine phosphatase [Fodinibius salinus]TYP92176.1 Stage II sporulation protein E (SpoIIE) [Fodinibius salinus]
MSLLNKNSAFTVRDYIFGAVGLLCLFGFFLSYSSQNPKSAINTRLNKNAAQAEALEAFNTLGYSLDGQQTIVSFESNRQLLDSLQANLGRQHMVRLLSDSSHAGIYPYYWEMIIKKQGSGGRFRSVPRQQDHMRIHLDESGQLIGFTNPHNVLPNRIVNKKAVTAAFDIKEDRQFLQSAPDSTLQRVLSFDIKSERNGVSDSSNIEKTEKQAHTYSTANIEKLAAYHLKNTGWEFENMKRTDLVVTAINSHTAAEVTFSNNESILGQDVNITLTILPTGALLGLEYTYNGIQDQSALGLLDFIVTALILLFGISVAVLLYFRIRSRTVDSSPALVVGIIAGLITPSIILLENLVTGGLFDVSQTASLLQIGLQMAFSGALMSVALFAVTAVGDSLMRQYWPDKLFSYDYVRQSRLFNKPIGETILRSVVLAGIACGFWSLILSFFPELYIEINNTFLSYTATWVPIYLFIDTGLFSLVLILSIFAVVGTKAYGMSGSKITAAAMMVLSMAVFSPALSVGPDWSGYLLHIFLSGLFVGIFLRWDLLTTLFTHFLFLLMLNASSGWIASGSPDLYAFLVVCGFVLFTVLIGVVFVTKGREHQSLPDYVPEYVKELAQEQRIKQELEIARDVQQSFLPVETPQVQGLDIAAICNPAYETGGDYYDIVQLDEHRLAVTIGDVSGKGIQAAFYMTFIKGILHSLCREIDSPAEILKKTNRLFYDTAPRGTFISLVYGIVDLRDNSFNFARAGHNPVIKISAENSHSEELRPNGIGVGLTQSSLFDDNIEELKLNLLEDDLLVLYTDGIVEALDGAHNFYGSKRLHTFLEQRKESSAETLLQELSQELYSFIGDTKQHDDMTILIIKRNKE